jgi:hypothetical protein
MHKMKMDVDALQVETFDVDGEHAKEGTVFGQQPPWTWVCTADGSFQCNEPTNWRLDANCADSLNPGEGNCTNVCPSGPLVCDTSVC